MSRPTSSLEARLCQALCDHPRIHNYRFGEEARNSLLEILFRSLTCDRPDYLLELFPNGFPESVRLQEAQGVQENAEYSEAARGHICGHIFKPNEGTYSCSTCTDDRTAVLCSRCFVASDHEGHQYTIGVSSGNSGCCDCGDDEAWKRPVKCAIHTPRDDWTTTDEHVSRLPDDLQESIRTTIGRTMDYFCDVISCAPENLRLPKTAESVAEDEVRSRLTPDRYVSGDDLEAEPEYCLIIWNDEKHTVREVQSQVARACRERELFGLRKADEANDIGRSIVRYSTNLKELIRMAKIIEEIKVTVTIRSARDTFREQMCGTMIEWLTDIAGSSIGGDSHILRRIICEEMLQIWRVGSEAWNVKVGREVLYDNGYEDYQHSRRLNREYFDPIQTALRRVVQAEILDEDGASDDGDQIEVDDDEDDTDGEQVDVDPDREMNDFVLRATVFDDADAENAINADPEATDDAEEMDTDGDGDFLDVGERMDMDGPTPPPPAVANTQGLEESEHNLMLAAETSPTGPDSSANYLNIPRTPASSSKANHSLSTLPNHWKTSTPPSALQSDLPVYEDLTKNIRIDSLILFDLRLWKIARTSIRDLFIGTLVNVPQFKRILGLRFSGLYTTLSQLYLVADREPDHSVINLSLQLLTTPSITEEVVERANFLTNLMAILYTFLTTRQVGFPKEVDPGATLGFDAGSVANRRLYHFFADLRYFLSSQFVQAKIRNEPQFLSQYLDLAKLPQGICPNVRAIGDHVEYETDAWISAALLTRDINKLCRQFSEAYELSPTAESSDLQATWDAISHAAGLTIINSVGLERRRFDQAEIKKPVHFHVVEPYGYKVVQFNVEKGSLSFHHPLHYTLSWLLECGKDHKQSIMALRGAAQTFLGHLNDLQLASKDTILKNTITTVDDVLLSLFDYPLRVCAWLAQMRANLWVRNGMSLRHQMLQYKSVAHRDVGYHRDLFLLQVALVSCDPARFLVSMIDRFGLSKWMHNDFDSLEICDDNQMLDLSEDFVYLLINLFSDRDALLTSREQPETELLTLRKDIAHTLCFRPLSYSDLYARLTERSQDHDRLQDVLDQMTRYRPPEGLHDSGLFELKEDHLQDLDPYNSHFTKNQRDEAENIYKTWMGKKLGKSPEDIVLEPKLHAITSAAFVDLCAVANTPVFADVIHKTLLYVAYGHKLKTGISSTRVEAFLQIVLQLALIATLEDNATDNPEAPSFVRNSINLQLTSPPGQSTIIAVLSKIWLMDEFSTCRCKIRHMLRLFHQKLPHQFTEATQTLDFPSGRFDTASPASFESDIEAKQKRASERKSKIMAQFQQQQQSFMDKQGVIDWGDDELASPEDELPRSTEIRHWKYPSGLCIQCREDTSDSRLYGTFAMISDAHVLRQTPIDDEHFVGELFTTPANLDRSIEHMRPFGVSGANHEQVKRMAADGQEVTVDYRGLGRGWPKDSYLKGPLSTSCGHIMHFGCFENYYQSVTRRHQQQVARNHPERIQLKEFVCPLCKALANTFLPIVWKHSLQSYPGALEGGQDFDTFMKDQLRDTDSPTANNDPGFDDLASQMYSQTLATFSNSSLAPTIARWQAGDLTISPTSQAWAEKPELAAFQELASVYGHLRETLGVVSKTHQNLIKSNERKSNQLSLLVGTLANTIASVEIGYRGREAEFGTSLLTSMPLQTLSHLQTLSSTIRAYAATGALTVRGFVDSEYKDICDRIEAQMAAKTGFLDGDGALLTQDAFQFMVEATMILAPVRRFSVHGLLQLCLTVELVRVVRVFLLRPQAFAMASARTEDPDIADREAADADHYSSLEGLVRWLAPRILGSNAEDGACDPRPFLTQGGIRVLYRICKAYALAFVRKSTIYFHVAHGVDFPTTAGTEASLPELDRLTHLLRLPDLKDLMLPFGEYSLSTTLRDRTKMWLDDCYDRIAFEAKTRIQGLELLHPAPLELIGLPQYFDVLMEESHRRKCPTTGKELTDPALCLFCGEIFCAQMVCCLTKDKRGGCNAHMDNCSAPIGMFLFIRKCHIAFLHVPSDPKLGDNSRDAAGRLRLTPSGATLSHGSFFPAPYLTKHGETDSGLRSKHQLILNQKRYDKLLRDTWLLINGSVWSTIARKLESEVNAGGWETL
jgi:E3 ubiquitin-protein ligase UBR1